MVAEGCLISSQPSTHFDCRLTVVGSNLCRSPAAQQFEYLNTLLVRLGNKPRKAIGQRGLQLMQSISAMAEQRLLTTLSGRSGANATESSHSTVSFHLPTGMSTESMPEASATLSAAAMMHHHPMCDQRLAPFMDLGGSNATESLTYAHVAEPGNCQPASSSSEAAETRLAADSHQLMTTSRYTTNQDSCRRGIAPTGAADSDATIIIWTDQPTAQMTKPTEMAMAIAAEEANRTKTRNSYQCLPTELAVATDCGADNLQHLPNGSQQSAALYIQRDVADNVQALPQWKCKCQLSKVPDKADASRARCQISQMPDKPNAKCQSDKLSAVLNAPESNAPEPDAPVPDAAEPNAPEPDAAGCYIVGRDVRRSDGHILDVDTEWHNCNLLNDGARCCNALKHDGGRDGCSRDSDAHNHGSLDNRTLDGYVCDGGANSDGLLVNTRLLNLHLGGRYPQKGGTLCNRPAGGQSSTGGVALDQLYVRPAGDRFSAGGVARGSLESNFESRNVLRTAHPTRHLIPKASTQIWGG